MVSKIYLCLLTDLFLDVCLQDSVASLKSSADMLPKKPKKSPQKNDEEDSSSMKIGKGGNRFLKTPISTADVKDTEITSQEIKKSPAKGNFLRAVLVCSWKFDVMW